MATATAATDSPLVVRDRAGGGLRLFWRQIFKIDGKTRSIGLGPYPLITLKEGRYKAFDNARKIALGEDILAPKREIPTVDQAFDQYMANRTPEWNQKGKRKAKETDRPLEPLQRILPAHTLQASLRRQRRGCAQRIPSHPGSHTAQQPTTCCLTYTR